MKDLLCPSVEELSDFAAGKLALARVDALAEHLEECGACAAAVVGLEDTPDPLVAQLRRSLPASTVDGVDSARVVALVESLGSDLASSCQAWKSAYEEAAEPAKLGQYVLLEKVGEGGMGQVYKARHELMNRVVALKIIHPTRLESAAAVQRFQREIRALAQLDHPNIVRAEYADQVGDTHFLVMEYIEGVNLGALVRRQGPLPVSAACACVQQAARGLQHAFEQGLVHRDLKPSNLMLTTAEQIKLLDLGLVRGREDLLAAGDLTDTGQVVGTVDYMAPEQADNPHSADTRADIYSLGCTLYFLLAGRAPFAGQEFSSVSKKLKAHALAPVPSVREYRADVPGELVAVLDRMLAKAPAQRYATPAEVGAALEPWVAGAGLESLALQAEPRPEEAAQSTLSEPGRTQALPGSTRRRAARSWRLGHALVAGGAALVVLLAVLLHVGVFGPGEASPDGADPKNPASLPGDAPSIVSFKIQHYRGDAAAYQGTLGITSPETRLDDDVRVEVELSKPGYCYLIAFNPDGEEQLCFPRDTKAAPQAVERFKYPAAETRFFALTDGAGVQAFVLLVSPEPLPAYGEWKARAGSAPWRSAKAEGIWHFDGDSWKLPLVERGKERERGVPNRLRDLMRFFRDQAPTASMQAWAFPVRE